MLDLLSLLMVVTSHVSPTAICWREERGIQWFSSMPRVVVEVGRIAWWSEPSVYVWGTVQTFHKMEQPALALRVTWCDRGDGHFRTAYAAFSWWYGIHEHRWGP